MTMLSLQDARKILGPDASQSLSDEELAEMMHRMRALADVMVTMFLDSSSKQGAKK